MNVIDDLAKASLRQETILTIGAFDGVHRGHQALIGRMVERARATDHLAVLVTFHPHPAAVLAPERAPRCLTTLGEKAALLERLGVDLVVFLRFDQQMAATPAREFMATIASHLRLRELWLGPDFALGRNREGDVPRLRELGREMGYEVHVVEPVVGEQGVISSSRIRMLLGEGHVAEAAQLLGRYPSLSGEVVFGARRGRSLGFPTANLEVRPERAVPANGVYAVFAVLGAERYAAVANVGVRPSFDNLPAGTGSQRTVETHILDFDQDIYGCDLVVEFVDRLRDERRFADIDDLVAQIRRDSEAARHILSAQGQAASSRGSSEVGCRHRYREIGHTADRALWVWGSELPDLFTGAARGMYSLLADLDGLVATDWRKVWLEALDRETLLVSWLNELLFLTEMERVLFVDYRIESLTEAAATDSAGAALADPARAALVARVGGVFVPVIRGSIKAATFHDLKIVQAESGWSTQITFDV